MSSPSFYRMPLSSPSADIAYWLGKRRRGEYIAIDKPVSHMASETNNTAPPATSTDKTSTDKPLSKRQPKRKKGLLKTSTVTVRPAGTTGIALSSGLGLCIGSLTALMTLVFHRQVTPVLDSMAEALCTNPSSGYYEELMNTYKWKLLTPMIFPAAILYLGYRLSHMAGTLTVAEALKDSKNKDEPFAYTFIRIWNQCMAATIGPVLMTASVLCPSEWLYMFMLANATYFSLLAGFAAYQHVRIEVHTATKLPAQKRIM